MCKLWCEHKVLYSLPYSTTCIAAIAHYNLRSVKQELNCFWTIRLFHDSISGLLQKFGTSPVFPKHFLSDNIFKHSSVACQKQDILWGLLRLLLPRLEGSSQLPSLVHLGQLVWSPLMSLMMSQVMMAWNYSVFQSWLLLTGERTQNIT